MIAWRRKQTLKGQSKRKDGSPVPTISPSTVNRSTTLRLKALFTRAKKVWRYSFPMEPNWQAHWLAEPQERVRELHADESMSLEKAIRSDYEPWLEFARLTGLRLQETLLRWSNVNWAGKTIITVGKGGRKVATPITPAVAAVLEPLKDHHPDFVFTFVCKRTRKTLGLVRGCRYPITYAGAKSEWRRARTRAQLVDFRFHDLRHDTATKLLRETKNLKLVKQALNHSDIKVTMKYAHVLNDEVAAGLEAVAESRKNSRTSKVGTG